MLMRDKSIQTNSKYTFTIVMTLCHGQLGKQQHNIFMKKHRGGPCLDYIDQTLVAIKQKQLLHKGAPNNTNTAWYPGWCSDGSWCNQAKLTGW